MSRVLIILALILLGMVGLAAILGHFAYGNEPTRSGRITLDGLQQPASIQWEEDGFATIQAAGEADLFAALGYVHAVDHAWSMTLWRKAALGQLSQWLGPEFDAFDRHARQLGFAALAEESYEELPAEDRALLVAYASGASRALNSRAVAQQDEFVLLDLTPIPWLPWHALAVERLMAWIGTPPIAGDSAYASFAQADSALIRFSSADSLFRSFLRLGGANQSRAWTAEVGSNVVAAQQIVYGSSALPLVQEVALRLGSAGTMVATVPGTLMLPAGHSSDRMWSVFLTSSLALMPTDSLPPPPLFDRVVDRDGNETLLRFSRSPDGLYFKAEPPSPSPAAVLASIDSLGVAAIARNPRLADSVRIALRGRLGEPVQKAPPAWLVRWQGFETGTDLGGWRALLSGAPPAAFTLFRGDGMLVAPSGLLEVLGSPPVQKLLPGGVFVAADSAATFAADRLWALLGRTDSTTGGQPIMDPARLVMDTYSPWAATITPSLVEQLGHRDSLDASIKDAYAFLHGWDYRYDRGSIAASLLDAWMVAYQDKVGRFPSGLPDSTTRVILNETLRDAMDRVKVGRGDRASDWRWELVQPGGRFFPVWNDTDRGTPPSRFAPIHSGLGGHPTALLFGPSVVFDRAPASASFTTWTLSSQWSQTNIYHPVTRTTGFLAGDRTQREPPHPHVVVRDAEMTSPLYLRPRA